MGMPPFDELNISHLDISLVLSKDSTQPVTLHVAVTLSAGANPSVSSRATATTASAGPPHVPTNVPVSPQTYISRGPSITGNSSGKPPNVEGLKIGVGAGDGTGQTPPLTPVSSEREKTIDEIIATIER